MEISAADAAALMSDQESDELFQAAITQSVTMGTFRTQRMSKKKKKVPVLSVLPNAGFVGTGAGNRRKPTTRMAWEQKYLEAEPIAAICPIDEDLLDDADFDIWGEVKPRLAEAVAAVVDGAILFGTSLPATWGPSLEDGARTAGNVYSAAAAGDLYDDLNGTQALVEADGFIPNQWWANLTKASALRGLRDSTGQPLFIESMQSGGVMNRALFGNPIAFSNMGIWVDAAAGPPAAGAHFITGDRQAGIIGMRTDLKMKVLTEATLTEGDGVDRRVVIALAEEDMVALRVVIRLAWQIADPVTRMGGAGAFPFAILGV